MRFRNGDVTGRRKKKGEEGQSGRWTNKTGEEKEISGGGKKRRISSGHLITRVYVCYSCSFSFLRFLAVSSLQREEDRDRLSFSNQYSGLVAAVVNRYPTNRALRDLGNWLTACPENSCCRLISRVRHVPISQTSILSCYFTRWNYKRTINSTRYKFQIRFRWNEARYFQRASFLDTCIIPTFDYAQIWLPFASGSRPLQL